MISCSAQGKKRIKREQERSNRIAAGLFIGSAAILSLTSIEYNIRKSQHFSQFGTLESPAYTIAAEEPAGDFPDVSPSSPISEVVDLLYESLHDEKGRLDALSSGILNGEIPDNIDRAISDMVKSMNQIDYIYRLAQGLRYELSANPEEYKNFPGELRKIADEERKLDLFNVLGCPLEVGKEIAEKIAGAEFPEKIKLKYSSKLEEGIGAAFSPTRNQIKVNETLKLGLYSSTLLSVLHEISHAFSQHLQEQYYSGFFLGKRSAFNDFETLVMEEAAAYCFMFYSISHFESLKEHHKPELIQNLIESANNYMAFEADRNTWMHVSGESDEHTQGMLLALAACEYFGNSSEAYRNLSTTTYSELKPEILSLADTIEQSYVEKKERLAGITSELSDLLLGMEKSLDMMELAHKKIVDYENSLYNK